MKTKLNLISASIATAMALAACGGGGGGSSTGGTTPPVSQTCTNGATDYPTCTPPANLQITVPTPTYPFNSDEIITFNELNAFRKSMGLGLLAQNTSLDTASKNHGNYIVNNKIFGHIEDGAKPGFTGVTPAERNSFAGYQVGSLGGEVIGVGAAPTGIRGLINTVYHRDLLAFQNFTDVGIGFNSGWSTPVVIDFGARKQQNNASNFSTTYPVDGQTNLPLTMMVESPNPFPELSTANSDFPTKTSSPVSFYGVAGSTISVTAFTVAQSENLSSLNMRLLTAANDPNKSVQPNVAHIVGTAPFLPNTKYVATFIGSMNGIPINKTWTFTTGTSLNLGGGAAK